MNFFEKASNFALKAENYMQKEHERMERIFKSAIREKSDQQILNLLNNVESSNWRYSLLQDEAYRRGL